MAPLYKKRTKSTPGNYRPVSRTSVVCKVLERIIKGLCVLGAMCLVCQDLVSCYFYFLLLPHGPELW